MKVLIIDQNGELCDLAWRATCDGHKIKHFIKDDVHVKDVARGLSDVVREYKCYVRWADFIILAENSKYLVEADSWRKEGIPVLGATVESGKWEVDRMVGQKIFDAHKIPTLPFKMFYKFDEAIAYVKKENKRFVSKPAGDEADKALSYCSKSAADMVFMLERWKALGKLKPPFMLQEFKEGIEAAVGCYFGPGGFNSTFEENWEFKKLLTGEMGPATGEQGTVMRMVTKSKLADKVLKPLEDALAATGHTGDVDVNCIIDTDGTPWPLEFTMRFGYPAVNIQNALHEGDTIEWLLDLVEGRDAKNFRTDEIATGVVLSIPDYPYSRLLNKQVCGIPIYGITDTLRESLHPCQVMMNIAPIEKDGKITSEEMWCTAGDYVLVATGTGETVSQSSKAAYKVLDKLSVPNSPMWRTDIGNRLKDQIPLLQKHGYATGMKY